MRKTINDEWLAFKAMVYPKPGMPSEQEKQLYRAFFAGALITFVQIETVADTTTTDEEAMRILEEIKREIFGSWNEIKAVIEARD